MSKIKPHSSCLIIATLFFFMITQFKLLGITSTPVFPSSTLLIMPTLTVNPPDSTSKIHPALTASPYFHPGPKSITSSLDYYDSSLARLPASVCPPSRVYSQHINKVIQWARWCHLAVQTFWQPHNSSEPKVTFLPWPLRLRKICLLSPLRNTSVSRAGFAPCGYVITICGRKERRKGGGEEGRKEGKKEGRGEMKNCSNINTKCTWKQSGCF